MKTNAAFFVIMILIFTCLGAFLGYNYAEGKHRDDYKRGHDDAIEAVTFFNRRTINHPVPVELKRSATQPFNNKIFYLYDSLGNIDTTTPIISRWGIKDTIK